LSCSGLETPVQEKKVFMNNDLDSLITLADEAIENLNKKNKEREEAQVKLNRRLSNIARVREQYKDSLDNLKSLKLISRDSVVYDYKIEICEITDTVKVLIPDSICPVCIHKKEKSFFNIFKKKK
jgi:rubrerythrin